MSSISIPDELYKKAAEIAATQHVSVDQVVASVFAEHLASWERLKQRAARGDRGRFRAVLDKAPAAEPAESDRS